MELDEIKALVEARKSEVERITHPNERRWLFDDREIVDSDGYRTVAVPVRREVAYFIASNDPHTVIRQCDVDLDLIGVLSSPGITVPTPVLQAVIQTLEVRYRTTGRNRNAELGPSTTTATKC